MATVYNNARHRKMLAKFAKAEVISSAEEVAAKARAELAAHRDTGASRIITRRAGVDQLVILEDDQGGAMAIEFGRAGGIDRKGRKYPPQEGKNILGRFV